MDPSDMMRALSDNVHSTLLYVCSSVGVVYEIILQQLF